MRSGGRDDRDPRTYGAPLLTLLLPALLLARLRLALLRLARVQRHGRSNQLLEGADVHALALVDVDGAADVSVQARVEEAGGVLQGGAMGEGQLHDLRVGLAGAHHA